AQCVTRFGDPLERARRVDRVELAVPGALTDVARAEDQVSERSERRSFRRRLDHRGIDVHSYDSARVDLTGDLAGERAGTTADVEHRHAAMKESEESRMAVGERARGQDAVRFDRNEGAVREVHAAGAATRIRFWIHAAGAATRIRFWIHAAGAATRISGSRAPPGVRRRHRR